MIEALIPLILARMEIDRAARECEQGRFAAAKQAKARVIEPLPLPGTRPATDQP